MWQIIYNILITLCLPFFILYGLAKQKIRKNLFERLFPSTKKSDIVNPLWIHAASIGEAVIAENIMQYMAGKSLANNFLITTNTYYTQDLLKKKTQIPLRVCALPFDFSFSVKRFLRGKAPIGLLIIETEIWPNLIRQAKKRAIPIIIVNGRISDSTFKNYLMFSFFMKSVFSYVDLVLAQSEEHRERFIRIGMDPSRVFVTGNIKYFRAVQQTDSSTEKNTAVTFGSIKEKELDAVYGTIKNIKRLFPDYTVYVAPRELHLASTIEKDLQPSFSVSRYSTVKTGSSLGGDIVVVDTIGDLLRLYGQSKVAFVGGSLAPYGGQNILEPLFFNVPVLFGPFMENFKDIAASALKHNAGIMVQTADELTEKMTLLLRDNDLCRKMGDNAPTVIKEQQQAMEKPVDLIAAALKINT